MYNGSTKGKRPQLVDHSKWRIGRMAESAPSRRKSLHKNRHGQFLRQPKDEAGQVPGSHDRDEAVPKPHCNG